MDIVTILAQKFYFFHRVFSLYLFHYLEALAIWMSRFEKSDSFFRGSWFPNQLHFAICRREGFGLHNTLYKYVMF